MIVVNTTLPPVGVRYSTHSGSWIHVPITLDPKPITRPGDTAYYRNLLVYVVPLYSAGVQVVDGMVSAWLSLGTEDEPDLDQVWFNPYLYCNPPNLVIPAAAQTEAVTYHFWLDFRLDNDPGGSIGQLSILVNYYDYGLDANPLLSGKVVI